ncbi:hypothetical protein EIP91_007765 [Steccherinum ochraceum]|uniref:Uncharacterized protein n=1 Tax=Steccherinum ochraceum TaxID=92696 RepID=A0A4R0RYM5_9APHY|nr:hypothetical protein EIP91_007765 [Steccherinum ochraceum]
MSLETVPAATADPTHRDQLIEKIFERVEAESERRAAVEETKAAAADEEEASQMEAEADDSVPSPVSPNGTITAASSVAAARQRRRGSVSVSRFGMVTDAIPEPVAVSTITTSLSPSTRPSRSSSIVLPAPKMYNVQPNHGSADSLASMLEDPSLQVEDHGHSTTMATIAGKQSISKAISQRLSRARTRSRDVLTSTANSSVIIGVAVQEATVEHHEEEHGDEVPNATVVSATVEGPNDHLKRRRSTPKLESQSSWMAKAKELTNRFKRKSMAALSPVS